MTAASRNSAAAFANASFASFARKTVLPSTVSPGGKITHLEADSPPLATCLAESTKIRSLEAARSGAATPASSIDPSPSNTAPIAAAKSFAIYFIAPPKPTRHNPSGKTSSQEIVKRRLALGPRFPARVHPHPLLRVFSNNLFGHFSEALRIFHNISFGIASSNQFQRRFESQPVFLQRFIPHCIARHYRCAGVQRHPRDAGSRASRRSEKIHKLAFLRQCILIGENANGSGFPQHLEHRARRLILENRLIARKPPIAIHQRIQPCIVQRPRHIVQRIPVQRVRVGRKLPRTHMSGQKQHTL